MPDSRQTVATFIERMSRAHASVEDLYAGELDWIEMPTGRRGGREDLFKILRRARSEITDYNFDVISLVQDGDQAVLESTWQGRFAESGKVVKIRVLWFWAFRDGLISKQHDYSIPLNENARLIYEKVSPSTLGD